MASKYYVLGALLYMGECFAAIAGPYDSKILANAVAYDYQSDGRNGYGLQNLSEVFVTSVANTTQMKKVFGISKKQALSSIELFREYEQSQNEVKNHGTI